MIHSFETEFIPFYKMANGGTDNEGYFFYFIPAGNGSDCDDEEDSEAADMSDSGKEAAGPGTPSPGPSIQVAT